MKGHIYVGISLLFKETDAKSVTIELGREFNIAEGVWYQFCVDQKVEKGPTGML